jgi:hypothetical protein
MTKDDLEEVVGYQFQYKVKEQKVNLHVKTKESGWIKKPVDVLPLEKAVFLMDMLRNEKPIYYHTVEGAIQTVGELVGEKE